MEEYQIGQSKAYEIIHTKDFPVVFCSRKALILTGTITEKVPLEKKKLYCLADDELIQLANLVKLVEKHYGSSIDTE